MTFSSTPVSNPSAPSPSVSNPSVPRSEYPRPQFERDEWLCLNGEWQFELDMGDSGLSRGLLQRPLQDRIIVPFCPESSLSGVHNPDFLCCVWYRRVVEIPVSWSGHDVLLHFGAVDYDATVWVNGVEVVRHRGGFTPFTAELRGVASPGEKATIVVRARDVRHIPQPRGKQSNAYDPHSCFYTRTTGIWQTVWMEPVSRVHMKRPRITPDVAGESFHVEVPLSNNRPNTRVRVRLLSSIEGGEVIAEVERRADLDLSPRLEVQIPQDKVRLWSTRDPHLYGLEIELVENANGEDRVLDRVKSYAGLRCVSLDGHRVKINGETVFQRLILDQGYYPDGVMTAPSDEALVNDIKLSLAAGFNGARLHQKVFEERFLYHADRLGYLCWGEFADWGCNNAGPFYDNQKPGVTYVTQWLEALERDYSHPSIIGWCGLNETSQSLHDQITDLDDATRAMFLAAKNMDKTRPVLDASGYSHRVLETDVYDSHDYIYEEDFSVGIKRFRERYANLAEGKTFENPLNYNSETGNPSNSPQTWSWPWLGQPYFVSEFGGFKWNPKVPPKTARENAKQDKESWGYGSDPVSVEDFYKRFQATCDVLLDNPYMFGYCYTQLTDVYPEENGIYSFDRSDKFDAARLHAIQTRPAAIELAEDDTDLREAAIRRYVENTRLTTLIDEDEQSEFEVKQPDPSPVQDEMVHSLNDGD